MLRDVIAPPGCRRCGGRSVVARVAPHPCCPHAPPRQSADASPYFMWVAQIHTGAGPPVPQPVGHWLMKQPVPHRARPRPMQLPVQTYQRDPSRPEEIAPLASSPIAEHRWQKNSPMQLPVQSNQKTLSISSADPCSSPKIRVIRVRHPPVFRECSTWNIQ